MRPKITLPYEGHILQIRKLITPDQATILYFASIRGRENPSPTEWANSLLSSDAVAFDIGTLAKTLDSPAVIAVSFPHVTKFMGWKVGTEKDRETNLYLLDFRRTEGMKKFDFNPREIGCLVENVIIGYESMLWAQAKNLPAYIEYERNPSLPCLKISCEEPNKIYNEMTRKK
ncbi:MAG: hypothetical protein V1743_01210 [Nanoarchaeota archaeon]